MLAKIARMVTCVRQAAERYKLAARAPRTTTQSIVTLRAYRLRRFPVRAAFFAARERLAALRLLAARLV
jgi:hypothetical protein